MNADKTFDISKRNLTPNATSKSGGGLNEGEMRSLPYGLYTILLY